jgi:hypothetical protein
MLRIAPTNVQREVVIRIETFEKKLCIQNPWLQIQFDIREVNRPNFIKKSNF